VGQFYSPLPTKVDQFCTPININREENEIIRRTIENFNQLPELQQSKEFLAYYQNEKLKRRS
jgi:hypothetical protein